MPNYGIELILDIHHCDVLTFTRSSIDQFFTGMCELLDMQQCERFWWDDVGVEPEERQTSPHTKGTSAVQFILTSNITIHTLDDLGPDKGPAVYLNIFSCKHFDPNAAKAYAVRFFMGGVVNAYTLERK